MKILRGSISCNNTDVIPDGAVAVVSVIDCSLACGPSKTLGKIEISDPKSFPFLYEVEYDESLIDVEVAVNCRIFKDEKLIFINDTRFQINSNGVLKDNVDFHVIVVN